MGGGAAQAGAKAVLGSPLRGSSLGTPARAAAVAADAKMRSGMKALPPSSPGSLKLGPALDLAASKKLSATERKGGKEKPKAGLKQATLSFHRV